MLVQWARTTIKRLDIGQLHETVLSMPLTMRKIVSVQHDVYISNLRGGLAPIYPPRLNYADMRTFTMLIYNGNSDPSNWAENVVVNICVSSFD